MYEWQWNIIWQYKDALLEGASVTLALTLFAVVLGTVFGVFLAFANNTANPVFRFITKTYIELFRALPTLVLLIWVYYAVPIIVGWEMSPFTAAVICLSLHLAAFVAETVRAGIESIPNSQYESGIALGMSKMQTMVHIVIPQAVRNMIPNLLGLYITEIKNSSLASVIAVNELLHRANIVISDTYRPLEIYTAVAIIYLTIILPLIALSRWIERHYSKGILFSSPQLL